MERATKDDKQVQRKTKNKMFHSPKTYKRTLKNVLTKKPICVKKS